MISVVLRFRRDVLQRASDRLIGGDATSRDQCARRTKPFLEQSQADAQSIRRGFQHRGLKARAEIADILGIERHQARGLVAHRRLQTREREVRIVAPEHWPRQGEARGIAAARGAFDLRPAGIGQAEHLRHLVEGFADRIIDRGAEPHIVADAVTATIWVWPPEARNRQ